MKKIIYKNLNLTKNIAYTAMFVAIGVLLPFVTAHAFTPAGIIGPGPIFLPMHIPVILGGLILGPIFGLIVGVLSPLLSSLITGMPVLYPMLPIMIIELSLYGAMSGLFYKKLKFPIFASLPIAMIIGRIGYGLIWLSLLQLNPNMTAPGIILAIQTGIPGIAIQLIIIPILIGALHPKIIKKARIIFNRNIIKKAKQLIENGQACLVIIKGGKIVHTDTRTGITAVLDLLENSNELLKGAIIVDKVVGKAAASLFILGKIGFIYGITMSRPAKSILEEANAGIKHDIMVDVIQNRTKTGACIIEQCIYDIFNPNDALTAIKIKLEELRKT
ncbi:MAG: DUF1893 domain-containing protein [Firmicutes bacterium]|nr:DUF1893 domain-containing protein [Bacillota bacterium]